MITVTLYNRKDCHLCDQVKAILMELNAEIPHRIIEVDVDSDPELRRAFGATVPVVEVGPYQLRAPINRQDLLITLRAAHNRSEDLQSSDRSQETVQPVGSQTWTGPDRFSYWVARHYLAVFNIFVLVYVCLPFLAPMLMKAGIEKPATVIYRAYGLVCHQLAFRSWFLFGEQSAYPRAASGVKNLLPFEQATGISGDDLFQARQFIGNEAIGYKVGLCERDVAIYGSILLFGLVFALSDRKFPGLPFLVWIIAGIVPIGLDGVSQVVSQPPLDLLPFRESTPFLRALTGSLFGFLTAWFGYPMVEATMADTRRILAARRVRLKEAQVSARELGD